MGDAGDAPVSYAGAKGVGGGRFGQSEQCFGCSGSQGAKSKIGEAFLQKSYLFTKELRDPQCDPRVSDQVSLDVLARGLISTRRGR